MRLSRENFKNFVPEEEQGLICALFDDLDDFKESNIYIDWQDWHNEYSSERTESCPDYYGYYTLRFENLDGETIGHEMTVGELDEAICLLFSYEYLRHLKKK